MNGLGFYEPGYAAVRLACDLLRAHQTLLCQFKESDLRSLYFEQKNEVAAPATSEGRLETAVAFVFDPPRSEASSGGAHFHTSATYALLAEMFVTLAEGRIAEMIATAVPNEVKSAALDHVFRGTDYPWGFVDGMDATWHFRSLNEPEASLAELMSVYAHCAHLQTFKTLRVGIRDVVALSGELLNEEHASAVTELLTNPYKIGRFRLLCELREDLVTEQILYSALTNLSLGEYSKKRDDGYPAPSGGGWDLQFVPALLLRRNGLRTTRIEEAFGKLLLGEAGTENSEES